MSKYSIDSSVIESEGWLIADSVVVYYSEFIDTSDGYDGMNAFAAKSGDVFIAYEYMENNDGDVVPVLYKTDMQTAEWDEEYEQPDYNDQFFYMGTAEIDGETYDKWRKIELGNEEFGWDGTAQQYAYTNVIVSNGDEQLLINHSTLTAIANKIREFVKILNNSANGYTIDPSVIKSEGRLILDSVKVLYKEYIDFNDHEDYDGLNDGASHKGVFVGYGFLYNDEDILVPVLYSTDLAEHRTPDFEQPFFYVGTAEIDGEIYDVWRKIEDTEDADSNTFTWYSEAQQYIYTNVIIQEDSSHLTGDYEDEFRSSKMYPSEIPDRIEEVYITAYDEGYYVGLSDGNTSINEILITENGTYDVTDCYEAAISVPSYNTVNSIDELPTDEPISSVATVLNGGNVVKTLGDTWKPKTWNGLTSFDGYKIWRDEDNIYYSDWDKQYVLNGNTWEPKTWYGYPEFYGNNIWSDGTNIYLSELYDYILNGDTWERITFYGLDSGVSLSASDVWTDGVNTYLSYETHNKDYFHYVLNGDTWETKTWNGLTEFDGSGIWSDGTNVRAYAYIKVNGNWSNYHYILNGDTWEKVSVSNSPLNFYASYVWSYGGKVYYTNNSTTMVFNGNRWDKITLNGLDGDYYISGSFIWVNGDAIYLSSEAYGQYVITPNLVTLPSGSKMYQYGGEEWMEIHDSNSYENGYDAGHYDGYAEGKTEGIEQGKEEGYYNGYEQGYAEGEESGIQNGLESAYDVFWDICQQNGSRNNYVLAFAGSGWTDENYDPKYPIVATDHGGQMFQYNTYLTSTKVPIIIDNIKTNSNVFHASYALKTIPSLKVTDKINTFVSWFSGCSLLEEVIFTEDSVIAATISFGASPKLSTASVNSVIHALKDLTGAAAQTLTFHADVGAALTQEQKDAITAKNWELVY